MRREEIYPVGRTTQLVFYLEGIGIAGILAYLFYETLWAAFALVPVVVLTARHQQKNYVRKQKWLLNLQFKDALAGMTSALSAGYSVENSISEALTDLKCIYREEALIVKEFIRMEQKIRLNTTIEQVFFEFAERSGIDDIQNFAWILYTAKRTGGDILKITRSTAGIIAERIEVNREVQTVISAKKLESNIMCLVPAGIIVYLKFGCPGFLNSMYKNPAGILVMSMVLIFYILSFLFSEKIVHIEV